MAATGPLIANVAWAGACLPSYLAFVAALDDPARAQERLLRGYVRANADTAFGREHGLSAVGGYDDFRRRVPVRDYDGLAPWIDRVAAGEPDVLSVGPVVRLVPSSGSTRAAKLVPYTRALQVEFARAVGPWIVDLYRRCPALAGGCAYWSITPPAARSERTAGGIPVGFDADSAYLGRAQQRLVDAVMAVGPDVARVADAATARDLTVRRLLARADLRLVSVWHPSMFELLLDHAAAHWDRLLAEVGRDDPRRGAALRGIPPGDWHAAWPALRLVSAWADAHADGPATALRRRLPHVPFQPKGLLATEGVVSIPFAGGWPLAARSHFLEFEDDDGGRTLTADALRAGAEYGVVLTTGGGLWRYRLGGRVRVVGFVGRTPSVRFVGRRDLVSDLVGEKLSEGFVGQVLRDRLRAAGGPARFAMLVPDPGPPARYTLVLETEGRGAPAADLARSVDAALRANPHYHCARDLGQLAAVTVLHVATGAYAAYVAHLTATGRRAGDVKPVALAREPGWVRVFGRAP